MQNISRFTQLSQKMTEKITIIDFGSQYTQLIARRVRELNVYSEIIPHFRFEGIDKQTKGLILSGSPCSVRQDNAPQVCLEDIRGSIPVLGICYGAQLLASISGGNVENSPSREYGLNVTKTLDASSFQRTEQAPKAKGFWQWLLW